MQKRHLSFMKKLCILTSSLPKNNERFKGNFVFDLAISLSKKGLSVTILTPHIFGSGFFEQSEAVNIIRFPYFLPLSLQKLADGKGIGDNINTSCLAFLQIPFLVCFEFLGALKIFTTQHFDYIHSHWIVPQGFVGAILSFLFTKKKHISTIHAADVFLLKKVFLHKYLLKFIIKNTLHFFVVSSYVHMTVLKMLLEEDVEDFMAKSSILPMGIDRKKFDLKMPVNDIRQRYNIGDDFLLLFIGRLSDKKGIEYLIHAMSAIIEYCDDVHLIICGDGPKKEYLIRVVHALELETNISFLGFIEETEKIELLSLADVVIVPSIVLDDGETEGMPVVILEGMAAGRAIIASNVSGVSDVIQDGVNGILVQEKCPDQISDGVIRLIKDPVLKKELGNNAKESSKYYDWDIISEEYFKQLS